ncbi:hypothetical protein CAL7716_101130 (plasmid) [Calothrix sp. PCC 7716]|nr:hypothetical protein CAL7716_101130 [Calothrix sp. PCC 7716]
MASYNSEIWQHKEWLGLLQPVGLVVSPPALTKAQAFIDRGRLIDLQIKLNEIVSFDPIFNADIKEAIWIKDFPTFAQQILGWLSEDVVGASGQEALPPELEVVLTDYGETLKPSYAVRDADTNSWMMLIQEVAPGLDLDDTNPNLEKSHGWKATVQEKFERLLRETKIPIGILCNGIRIRLVYAPQGESSGHLTFPVQAMCEVPGRQILGALEMLLSADRLFNVPTERRLPKLLSDSREYQAEVSNKLAVQVLDALWELLRGFQTADAATNGRLLGELAHSNPQHIYGGLITTLMRLVFLLYAENRGLMPGDDVYQRNYSVAGLYERLREDATSYPDTMEQRYGAWAWLLSLVRLVYDGGGYTNDYLPARHGQLFDPDEYAFLEGRTQGSKYTENNCIEPPRVPDGIIYRVLEKLLILDGERLSYRSLDVEQIGSVYEAIMGYEVEVATGLSIAVRPKDVVVNVDDIVAAAPKEREKILQDADCKLAPKSLPLLKAAKTPEEVVAALGLKVSSRTPNLLPAGSLYLQPGEERRRTGSHYTPRKLTQPIVETTLRPILENLGERLTAEQILSLKVCDIAMGSGAFLVEACRQLAEKVVEAWNRDNEISNLPDDVEPLLVARRLVAQRCLYGVDKNFFAVNLAKLSIWLVTLAKDYPFTFLDHAFKCGDSLVGLTKQQITSFGKDATYDELPLFAFLEKLQRARTYRAEIQALDTRSDADDDDKRRRLQQVEIELQEARLIADVKIAAFFEGSNKKQREEKEKEYAELVRNYRYNQGNVSELDTIASKLRNADKKIIPFNWEIEFPEVFDRENSKFDCIIGNPPFAGKNTTINAHAPNYSDWLKEVYPESHGNSDLVAFFFRWAFEILREGGTLGLIATNTIAQGDTRNTGLRYICQNKGTIYNAQKRVKWVGKAAVVVSIINIFKGGYQNKKLLGKQEVSVISAFLSHAGGDENPSVLLENANKSFQGPIVLGMGFTFDDSNPNATSIAEMHHLTQKNLKNLEIIFPYIGGEEVNNSPTHAHHRYVINFGEMSEDKARQYDDLIAIVEQKVKPERDKLGSNPDAVRRKKKWWLWGRYTPALFKAIAPLNRVLVSSCGATAHLSLAFLPSNMVYANTLAVFAISTYSGFCILQSRVHEIWARFFGSSMKDDLRYTPSDCFETFPFPKNWETNATLESVGKGYYEYRAQLIIRNNQGLTDTYNRFHDPEERDPDILKLRELHAQMDRAVLDAYGWHDISTECEFLLDYEEEEETTTRRKKPWRLRWPEEVHDEVLAKILELNQERAEEEALAGKATESKTKKKPSSTKKKTTKSPKATSNTLEIPGFPSGS